MRRKKIDEVEFPREIELTLVGASIIVSALIVFGGMAMLNTVVNHCLEGLFTSVGGAAPAPLSLMAAAWQLMLVAFGLLSVQCYLGLRRALARQLGVF
jgi:hypothetical protein